MTDQICYDLPRTDRLEFFDPESEECFVEFRLIYEGPLPTESRAGGRAKEKQSLRKHFHKQLRELWEQHPELQEQSQSYFLVNYTAPNKVSYPGPGVRRIYPTIKGEPGAKTWLEHVADDHEMFGYKFVPLVTKAGGFTCSLDILFLRRDNPGNIVRSGGDIDNRIKVLFDGLRMPGTKDELAGDSPEPHEVPFFCLLEDDSLITSVSVTTDRLLTPQGSGEKVHDVGLVIHVTVVNPAAVFAGGRLV
jgi:hypothetical protein